MAVWPASAALSQGNNTMWSREELGIDTEDDDPTKVARPVEMTEEEEKKKAMMAALAKLAGRSV